MLFSRFQVTPLLVSIVFVAAVLFSACDRSRQPPLPENSCSSHLMEGYTDKVSYSPGGNMKIYLHAQRPVELCRLTFYNVTGDSAFSIATSLPFQPFPGEKGSLYGYDYITTAELKLPLLKSGIYRIENKIPFLVKSKDSVDLLVIYPSNTVNAYCDSGGKSLYSLPVASTQVSFQRPMVLQHFSAYCLKWFETFPDVSIGYISDADLEKPENLKAKVLVMVGHSEYWTHTARTHFDDFVDNGGHALILSGNTMWWQVRYSDDGNTLFCYRDVEKDPEQNPALKTIEWNAPSLNYPLLQSIGADFTHGGFGVKKDIGWDGLKVISPNSPLLKGTNLKKGDIISLPTTEYDGSPVLAFDRDGFPIVDTASFPGSRIEIIAFDRGSRDGDTTPTFTVYQRNKNSGVIINAGTTDWCGANGMGGKSSDVIKQITTNAIQLLLKREQVFTD
jgi:hypothetical protein